MAKRRNRHRTRISGYQCVYCGLTEDHWPPQSLTIYGLLIPACRECNNIAGTNWASDFLERVAYVKENIAKKNKRVLRTPDWSVAELKRLGHSLRTKVESWQERKNITRERLAWSAEHYLCRIDTNNDFARFHAEINSITERE